MRVFLSGLSLPTTYAQSISKHRVTILTDIEADPDGDNLSFLWFAYRGEYKLGPPKNAQRIYGTTPKVEKTKTIHIMLKVTDKGSPALSRYKRVILRVFPN